MDLLGRLAGQPDANENFMKQVQYATGAWSNLMENMTFKAAGRELLRAVESATPEKPVDEESVRKIGLKYNLTPDRMGQLKIMLVESGALPLALKEQQRKMRDEELLTKASEDTGLTSDAAMDARKKEYLNKVAPQPVALETYMEADGTPVQVPKGTPAPAGTVPLAVWKVNEQNEQREKDRTSRESMRRGTAGGGGQATEPGQAKPAGGPGGKILPAGKVQELGKKEQSIAEYETLLKNFNPSYAGAIVGGPTATKAYERLGVKQDRVDWWKQFKLKDAKIRNELFGASLTANEQAAWDSVTVSENSNPEVIKKALSVRAKIAKQALEREKASYKAAGYNTGQKAPGKFKILRVE